MGLTLDATIVLAFALWLLCLAPEWVLLLWGMKNIVRVRQAVARSFWMKLLTVGSWIAAILLAIEGTVWACRDILGPTRLDVQRILSNGTLVGQGLLIVTGVLMEWRRSRGGASSGERDGGAAARRE
jgi:hypothetical protein